MRKKLLSVMAVMGMAAMTLIGCTNAEGKSEETTGTQTEGTTTEAGNQDETSDTKKEQKDTVVASSVAVVQILDELGGEMVNRQACYTKFLARHLMIILFYI